MAEAILDEEIKADSRSVQDKLKYDLEQFQIQYKEVLKQSEELQKSQQNLVRQKIALEALISYLSVKTN
jgi:hypothetical protein